MDRMRNCVVSLLDLVDMNKFLAADGPARQPGIDAMEALDRICNGRSQFLQQIDHIYCWNDSALFLSYLDMPMQRSMNGIVDEVSQIKKAIDSEYPKGSFVVMVKGKSFLPNGLEFRGPVHQGGAGAPIYQYIRASSMALANCDVIVKMFSKDHHAWYIDQRIRDDMVGAPQQKLTERGKFNAFPGMDTRKIYTAEGYFHQDAA